MNTHSVVRGTGIVGSLTLLSRLLGFIRDMLVARLFGSGLFADAYIVAFRIPNLLRSLVAEGALVSAFVPIFARELKHGHDQAQRAFSAVTGFLLLTTTALSILGIIFAPQIVSFFAPGFESDPEKFSLCVLLTRIMLPYIMCVSLVALLNGALNSVKIFGASALAQVVMNLVLIAGAWIAAWMGSRTGVIALSVSVIVGGVAQLLAQIPALRRSGFSLFPSREVFCSVTKQLVLLMFPAIIGATVYQLTIFLNTCMASLLPQGSVSWLFYADRLTQLPIGVFSIALASVLLPTLSQAHVDENKAAFTGNLMNALRYTSFIMIPVSCGLYMLARPLIEILFQRGRFDAVSTINTAFAVQAYAVGLWGMSCHSMIVRAFIAQRDTVTATLVGAFSLVLTFTLSLLLIGEISAQPGYIAEFILFCQQFLLKFLPVANLAHSGLALSSSIAATCAFVILSFLLHGRLNKEIAWKAFFITTLKSLLATAAMIYCLQLLTESIPSTWILLGLGIPGGALVYAAASFLLKSPELQETFALFLRLSKRRLNKSR
ncbi:MAG: murein biosynthesis integral membrane protein MurJ [Deltaproteobacteria bacterium]|nr:murein biosynthesis integral membrane protein MurJ [Deltaproteobacteria bacterium]